MRPTSIQRERIRTTLDIQYPGIGIETFLDDFSVTISRKTGRIRGIYSITTDERLFSLRTSDGRFLPTYDGGGFLLSLGYNHNRIVMNDDAAPFIARGKSAFCKHVMAVDKGVFPGGEVLLVDRDNNLLAVGTAQQPGYAILTLQSGVAARVKHARDR